MLILLVEKFFTWLSERASGNFEKIDDSEELQDLGDIDDMEAGGDEDAQAIMLDGGGDGGGADGAELSVNGDAPAVTKAQKKKKKKKKHGTHDSASHGHSQGHGHSHGLPLNVESPLLPYILTVGANPIPPSAASVPISLTAAEYSHVATPW